jgi:hypothetical protein
MKNRQEILQWALNLLNHHYMHQEILNRGKP